MNLPLNIGICTVLATSSLWLLECNKLKERFYKKKRQIKNMNFTIIKNTAAAIICAAMLIPASSCVKDNFTVPSPGANVDPAGIAATMTIKQFKQHYYQPILGKAIPTLLTDSTVIISGIINADDRSGNFYKTISLQDSTGGLQVKIAGTSLYYDYPIGRKIWIKTKGLYIFDYGGTLELGGYIDLAGAFPNVGGIATSNAPNSIIKGRWGLDVPVQKISIHTLLFNANYIDMQSMLYEIDDVEFSQQDTGGNYGNALSKASVNVVLNDCASPPNSMVVRSSGYANFATAKPAKGHGNIRGIYTYYTFASTGNTQLVIRDTTDVMFTGGTRCH
jgi:hypothetical protein